MNCQWHKEIIDQVCLNPDCSKQSLICQKCWEEHHERHPSMPLQKYRQTMEKYLQQQKSVSSLTFECKEVYNELQYQFQDAFENINRQKEKLNRMVEFIENLNQQLLDLQPIGEAELVYLIIGNSDKFTSYIGQLDKQKDVHLGYVNDMLCKFFLHLKVQRFKDQENGNQDIRLIPSVVSEIRSKILLQKRTDFAKILNEKILDQENQFEKFLKEVGEVFKREKSLLIPKQKKQFIDLEFQYTDSGYQEFKKKVNRTEFKLEDCNDLFQSENIQSTDKLEKLQNAIDGKKQMFKLCAYLVFYTNLQCEETQNEPVLKGNDTKKLSNGEIEMPIQCEFCKLMKLKTFIEFYYRFDLIQRFGKLCKFTEKNGRIIWVHEMCLLWSNRVNVDPKFNTVDIQSLLPAIQEAEQQICRYCSTEGASLKCNKPECQVHLHFYCIKQLKLRGIQFDVKEKFRFFCEDHHRKLNTSGHSEWFLTRYRLKQLVAKNGIDETKKKNGKNEEKIEEDSYESFSEEEPKPKKKKKNEQ